VSDFFKQICDDIERMASLAVKLKRSEGANVKFEMCEWVGLEIKGASYHYGDTMVVRASDVERVLAEGKQVFFQKDTHSTGMSYCCDVKDDLDTHSGLLIAITPIKPKDTAEQVLKEWVQYCEASAKPGTYDNLLYRARKVLGEK